MLSYLLSSIVSPVFASIHAIWAIVTWILFAPLTLLERVTPIERLAKRFSKDEAIIAQLAKEAMRMTPIDPGQTEKDRFLQGDRLKAARVKAFMVHGMHLMAAELRAPSSKYPTLYADVPEDLRRSIVADGRVVNGEPPAQAFIGLKLTPEYIESAWRSAVRAAVRAGYATILFGVLLALVLSTGPSLKNIRFGQSEEVSQARAGDARSGEGSSMATPAMLSNLAASYIDIWQPSDAQDLAMKLAAVAKVGSHASATSASVSGATLALLTFTLLLCSVAVIAAAIARLMWIGRFRYLVFQAANASVDHLRHSWREALQRWRWRLAEREMEMDAYASQVHFANHVDKSPLLDVGQALGLLEFRGHLLAPLQHQPVRMSLVDMLQHVEVLGGSGEGKSRDFYIPVARQLLALRKQGYPIAIYATDDKGAIGADIVEAARAVGLPEAEIIVVGTGPNDWRVDLLDGVAPTLFADVISSVAKQAGGQAADDFWPKMASDLLLQVAVVLQAAELTEAGYDWMVRNDGMRMYSLLNILRVASNDEELESALQIVGAALQDKNGQYACIAHLDKDGLIAASDYLSTNWLTMVDATKDGIRANARNAIRTFAFKAEIAEGFADGRSLRLLSASQLHSNNVKVVNVSQIEHGSAGRLVAIMLKTLFFKQARDAEQQDPGAAKRRLQWWFDPKPGMDAATQANYIEVFLADEYQSLVTSDLDGGLSDATVWNVLRSSLVAGVLLSQSVSAYRMMVGDKVCDNMRRNWRSKIILRTEDLATIEEAKKLAGKTSRFSTFEWDHMESAVAVRRERGYGAEALPEIAWSGEFDHISLLDAKGLYQPFNVAAWQNAYEVDERFMADTRLNFSPQQQPSHDAARESARAAHWRQEDRTINILQHGASEADAVHEEDIMQMGRGRALVFVQRSGGTRVDVVRLNAAGH